MACTIAAPSIMWADIDIEQKKRKEEAEADSIAEIKRLQQSATYAPPKIVPDTPTSPQAQAFSQLGNYEVNNSSGIPNIGIPLFEIDFYGYTIPLNLQYEAQPLKPGYNYDVYGLGWTLSGNSCVARTIHDRADEVGLFNNAFKLDNFENTDHSYKRFTAWANSLHTLNYQYDSYSVTLPSGRNIPFFMYKEGNVMRYDLLETDSNVRIVCSYSTNSINSFVVTDEEGVKYTFNIADKATNSYANDYNADRNVAWLLSRIDIPNKGSILYEYNNPVSFTAYTIPEPSLRISHLFTMEMVTTEPSYRFFIDSQNQSGTYTMRFLKKITYGTSAVTLSYSSDQHHVSSIKVTDNSTTIKNFALTLADSKLTALTITGTNTSDQQKYRFSYWSTNPGTKIDPWGNLCNSSSSEDIGNFNIFVDKHQTTESDMNSSLSAISNRVRMIAPKPTDLSCFYKLKLQSQTSGDSRQATSPESHGILSSITYPNGGKTVFTFENHRFPTATAADGDFVFNRRKQRIIEGGGFRIKSIKNYTAANVLANQEEYRYGFTYRDIDAIGFPLPKPSSYSLDSHIGCGEAIVDPNILTYLSFDYSQARIPSGFLQMLLGIHVGGIGNFEIFDVGDGGAWWWEARFNAMNFRKLLGGRRAVVYPEITIYHGNPDLANSCIGKTVYKYDIYAYDLTSARYYLSGFGQTSQPDTAYFEPINYISASSGSAMTCREFPERRDRLTSKLEYGKTTGSNSTTQWLLNSKEEYSYREDAMTMDGYQYNSLKSRGHCGYHNLSYGLNRNEMDIYLNEFYSPVRQYVGKSQLIQKNITQGYRMYGNNASYQTTQENYSYVYGGKLSTKTVWDEYEKTESTGYVGNVTTHTAVIDSLVQRNMLAIPISSSYYATYSGSALHIQGTRIDYGFFSSASGQDKILPQKLYERFGNTFEESIEILSYSPHGHPQEIINKKTGIKTTYVWDYDDRYLVLQADNATWEQVSAAMNTGNVRAALPNAMVHTWTYEPLIGVTSYTDASGKTTTYEYDGLGRLKSDGRKIGTTTEKLHDYRYNFVN